jgi:NADPH-dependent 2,4-dienoyl-CoA reductase/sulfur reductase-like enzyme
MNVVILGNGVAGVTAALRIRKRHPDARLTLVSGESLDYYSRPALMYLYMGHMRFRDVQPHPPAFWRDHRIERVQGWVDAVDVAAQTLRFRDGRTLSYEKLLLATGSTTNKFGWPGQSLRNVQGFCNLQDLQSLEEASPGLRRAVIVGGGLIGVELAEMLLTRGIHVTFLVREPSYWSNALPAEESAMVTETVRAHGIDLRLSTELRSIEDDGTGRAGAIVTNHGERIECGFVGLTTGVKPHIDFLAGSGIPTRRGVLVDTSFRARVPNVFAAGDCAEITESAEATQGRVEQLWYTAKKHGEIAGDVIAGEVRTYSRGVWFNSAKFFDLEWQTYGDVPGADARAPSQRHLWWRHPQARIGMRVVLEGGAVHGVNALGLRQRHVVWERWIRERRPIDFVLRNLHESHFDPEFARRHDAAIAAAFREQLQ